MITIKPSYGVDALYAPRRTVLDPILVESVRRMDVERLSVADVWRQAGALAVSLGLIRPSYHSVLKIVLTERRRRAERRAQGLGFEDS